MTEEEPDHELSDPDDFIDDVNDEDLSTQVTKEESDHEFSDPDDFIDDVSDEDLLGDLLVKRPKLTSDIDTVVVVDHAPKVGSDRMEKLQSVLKKVVSRFGKILSEYYPVDADNVFKGFFFIEYSKPEEALTAVQTCDGYKLDKSHIFAVNLLSDFDKYRDKAGEEEEWVPPEKTPFAEIGNLRSWLQDQEGHDQYALIYDGSRKDMNSICYNTPQEPRVVIDREHWTDTYLQWSPLGSYLTTFHNQGVALWGTSEFKRLGRYTHAGATLADFSPCERYLVTLSNIIVNPKDLPTIIIWDVKTGRKKRSFTKLASEDWPVIKWSYDGLYFAKKGEDVLSIYDVPSFGLLDKKSLIVKGIKDFSWSPRDHLIAYWLPEQGELPSKIIITRIPSRLEVATKSRHLVSECKLQWHKQGDYLCVKVDHWVNKSKKNQVSCFELFHTRENEIPIDSLEVKEPVIDFSLEPNGNKLAIIHGEPPTRISVSFHKINEKGTPPTMIKMLEKQGCNTLFWSPAGQFIVLAGLKSMDGMLEFIDTSDVSLMHRQEHTKVTDLSWDPTGRYVVSSLSYWTEKMDTGFIVWSFQGKLLHRSPRYMERFCQLVWRPRPPSLLTDDDIKTIRKDFKKYQYIFEQKDRSIKTKASKGLMEKHKKELEDFRTFQEKKKQEFIKRKAMCSDYMKQLDIKLSLSREIIEISLLIREKTERVII